MHTDDEKLPPVIEDDDEDEAVEVTELDEATPPSQGDTPIMRVTIDLMELNELDNQLAELRRRRLERSDMLRRLMAQRRDNTMRAEMARFERIVARVRKMLEKAEADEMKLATELNKLRGLAVAMEI